MSKIVQFFLGSIDEIRNKISWSPYSVLKNSSALVMIFALILAIIVGMIDFSFKNMIAFFYKL